MLKQNGQFYYLDLDTGELTKKNERGRAAVRQQKQELLSINEAKQVSSVSGIHNNNCVLFYNKWLSFFVKHYFLVQKRYN